MKVYKKWFLVNVDDKDEILFAFVEKAMEPKGKNPFYEINGIRYNVVSKSKWLFDKVEVELSKQFELHLKNKLKGMDKLTLLTEGSLIEEQIKRNGYWKYQEIYVKKATDK